MTIQVKGAYLAQVSKWVDEQLGANSYKAMIAAPFHLILATTWYDLPPLYSLISEVCEKRSLSIYHAQCIIAERNAAADLTTIYKVFLKVLSPKALLSQLPRIWDTYVKGDGKVRVVSNARGRTEGECEIDAKYADWARANWAGFLPSALQQAGAKNVSIDTSNIVEAAPGRIRFMPVITYSE